MCRTQSNLIIGYISINKAKNYIFLKKMAESINQQVQEESRELMKRSTEIVRYRRLQRNANTAIQQISMCLPMLENYAQLQKLMEQKKYFSENNSSKEFRSICIFKLMLYF